MPTSSDSNPPKAHRFLAIAEELALPCEWSFFRSTHAMPPSKEVTEMLAGLLHKLDQGIPSHDPGAIALSQADLIELATQTWRLEKRVQAMDPNLDSRAFKQFSDSVRRFGKVLQRFSVEYQDVTNKPYTSGWQEVEVVNWDEPDGTPSPVPAGPWVKQTIAPIIRRNDVVIKLGQVICVDMPDL